MFHLPDTLNTKIKNPKSEKNRKKKTQKNDAEKRLKKFMENITNRRTMEFKFGTSKTLFKKIQQKKESHKTKPEVIPTTILPNKNSVLVNFLTSKSPRKFHKEIRLRFILSVAYCYRFI